MDDFEIYSIPFGGKASITSPNGTPLLEISCAANPTTANPNPAGNIVKIGGGSTLQLGAVAVNPITLQTDGVDNDDQTVLNLTAGANITLTAGADGVVEIAATGGGGGGVSSVTGLNTDNTDPANPVVQISVSTGLSGAGTPGDPLAASAFNEYTGISADYSVLATDQVIVANINADNALARLPNWNTVGNQHFWFVNRPTNTGVLTVGTTAAQTFSNGAFTLTVNPGEYVHVQANDSGNGWLIIDRSNNDISCDTLTTTSNATIGGTLYASNVNVAIWGGVLFGSQATPITTKTDADSPYTASATDSTIIANPAITTELIVQLPPAASAGAGRIYQFKLIGLGTLVIDADGSDSIDGEATANLVTQYSKVTIQSDGSNWYIIG